MTTMSLRQVIDRTIIHDLIRRDLKSADSLTAYILAASLVVGVVLVASGIVELLP